MRATGCDGKLHAKMVDEIKLQHFSSEFISPGPKIFSNMAAENPRQQIYQARYHEKPCRQEMQAPAPAILIKNFIGTTGTDR